MKSRKPSLVRLLAGKRGGRSTLFGLVAERIRTGMLDPDEADVIATWFERLAAGEQPAKVMLGETRGRPSKTNPVKIIHGEAGRLPDYIELCSNMRRAIAAGHSPESVYKHVAKLYGVTQRHVGEIYESVAPTLADPPK